MLRRLGTGRAPRTPVVEAPTNLTPGASYQAYVWSPVSGSTYNWTIDGGTLQADTGTMVTFTAGSSGEVIISCIETNYFGTAGSPGTRTSTILTPMNCMAGFRDGGDGVCVADGTCSPGYHGGGWVCNPEVDLCPLDPAPCGWGPYPDCEIVVEGSNLTIGVAMFTAAGSHTYASMTDGGAQDPDYNASSHLGDGTETDRLVPLPVYGLDRGVAAIAAGGGHTCALTTAGGVQCWGRNDYGQLGNGSTTDSSVPQDVSNLTSGVVAIAAGGNHTCALTIAGAVLCWGGHELGQLPQQTGAT